MKKSGIILVFILSLLTVRGQVPADLRQLKPISLFQPLMDNHEISGVITLLATRDKIISLEAAGYSNMEKRIPMKTDDLFWIASQTKPIVAFAFMMLLEEKGMTLDDTLYNYIKAFRNQRVEVEIDENISVLRKPKVPIMFRDLLNHTSGLPAEPPVQKGPYDRVLLEDIMPGYAYTHLKADPGEKEIYSSMGINTIGRMIEILSGMKFDEFLKKRIFEPLGMNNTIFIPDEEQLGRLATAYKKEKESLVPVPLGFTQPLTAKERVAQPFGGLFSTAEDLLKFCRMCLNGGEMDGRRYLSKPNLDSMLVRRSISSFGAGFVVYKNGSYGHSGAFNTDMTISPKSGVIAITMVQAPGYYGCRSLLHDALWRIEEQNEKKEKSSTR